MGTVLALIALFAWSTPSDDSTFVERARIGAFTDAGRISAIGSEDLLVADAGTNEVYRLDQTGERKLQFGGFGWAQGSFDRPNGIATDGVNVYVSDWGNHRIQRFDRKGIVISSLSTRDTSFEGARFGHPEGVGITKFGDLLVLDGENQRILKFTSNAFFDHSFSPAQSSQLYRELVDVHVASSGRISVLDRGQLIVLDEFGSLMRIVTHPWFDKGRGVGGDEERTVVVCDSGLVIIPHGENLLHAISLSEILWAEPPGSLRDVQVRGRDLFVLTSHRIIILGN